MLNKLFVWTGILSMWQRRSKGLKEKLAKEFKNYGVEYTKEKSDFILLVGMAQYIVNTFDIHPI
ncbi:MAG TPA: hypothetical protein VMW20_05980 [Candidatus Nanoarchaeia archaeon]|nr:hypothetical protein [Candidatus Nanoarchaeia archaeon]